MAAMEGQQYELAFRQGGAVGKQRGEDRGADSQ